MSQASRLATGLGVAGGRVVSGRLTVSTLWFNFCGRCGLGFLSSSENDGFPSFSGIGQFQKG